MNKTILIGIIVVAVAGVAYWLISPFWRNVKLDEPLPPTSGPIIEDNMMAMSIETKLEFMKQTEAMKDKMMIMHDAMPKDAMPKSETKILSRAPMVARAHDVQGEALLVETGDIHFLRFENLKTINGPDLRIYLSAGLHNKDFIDLGSIRATEGSVNYPIPPGTDIAKYRNALIWCRAFSVLFNYAQL